MIVPELNNDPLGVLCGMGQNDVVCYRVGSAVVDMTAKDTEAMRYALVLYERGRVELVQACMNRTADGIGTYAYLAIGRRTR